MVETSTFYLVTILEAETTNGWKPNGICQIDKTRTTTTREFFFRKKRQLDSSFQKLGLKVKRVFPEDYKALMKFIKAHFYGHAYLTPARMYQIISFGESIMLVNEEKEIKGYILEVSYLKDKISHGASMAVHPELAGYAVGTHLFSYSAILAMNNGAVLKKGIISPQNFSSIKSIVNGSGAVVIDLQEDLFEMGPKLIFNLPLIPTILDRCTLSMAAIQAWLKQKKLSRLAVDDLAEVKRRLTEGEVIVAMLESEFITCPASDFYAHYLR